jgi:hypothetical protein
MRLAGTPAQPHLNGEWRGDDLAVRALDQGMRLERGKLLLQLRSEAATDVRLLLKELSFESELQPLPRTLLLDSGINAGKLRAGPGRIEASGELRTQDVRREFCNCARNVWVCCSARISGCSSPEMPS